MVRHKILEFPALDCICMSLGAPCRRNVMYDTWNEDKSHIDFIEIPKDVFPSVVTMFETYHHCLNSRTRSVWRLNTAAMTSESKLQPCAGVAPSEAQCTSCQLCCSPQSKAPLHQVNQDCTQSRRFVEMLSQKATCGIYLLPGRNKLCAPVGSL